MFVYSTGVHVVGFCVGCTTYAMPSIRGMRTQYGYVQQSRTRKYVTLLKRDGLAPVCLLRVYM